MAGKRIKTLGDAVDYAIRELRDQSVEHQDVDQKDEAADCDDAADILAEFEKLLKSA